MLNKSIDILKTCSLPSEKYLLSNTQNFEIKDNFNLKHPINKNLQIFNISNMLCEGGYLYSFI